MSEPLTAFELITTWQTSPPSGVYLNSPASAGAIEALRRASETELGISMPESFLHLLELTNGMQLNGAFFKEAETLVLENRDLGAEGVIVLGNAGNLDAYVYDPRDGKFSVVNFFDFNERFESYETCEEMLLAIMRSQEVV